MNMLRILIIAILLTGCANKGGHLELEDLASANQSHLSQISIGMSKNDVFLRMGNSTSETHDGIVNNPWTVESFMDKDGSQCEILYYVTHKNQPFTPVRKSLTTAVVLKDGKVVGLGENALQQFKQP